MFTKTFCHPSFCLINVLRTNYIASQGYCEMNRTTEFQSNEEVKEIYEVISNFLKYLLIYLLFRVIRRRHLRNVLIRTNPKMLISLQY